MIPERTISAIDAAVKMSAQQPVENNWDNGETTTEIKPFNSGNSQCKGILNKNTVNGKPTTNQDPQNTGKSDRSDIDVFRPFAEHKHQ